MTRQQVLTAAVKAANRLFRKRNAARELALIGIEKRRRTINEVAQQIRRELGLPPSPALMRKV